MSKEIIMSEETISNLITSVIRDINSRIKIESLENEDMFLTVETNNKIKAYEQEISRCYEREKELKIKLEKSIQHNAHLERKYNKMRELTLEPWEKYTTAQDETGR